MQRSFAISILVTGLVVCAPLTTFAQDNTSPAPETVIVPETQAVSAPENTTLAAAAESQPATAPVVTDAEPSVEPAANAEPVEASTMQLDVTQAGNVSVDFRDADIRNVLKVLAYKSGVNIIAGPEVVGLVTIQLKDVPWQKALEVILSTYGYSYEQRGTIITVSTVENLKKRREDAKALADQEPLSTETFILTFGKATEIKEAVDKMKSARGSVNIDKRTNAVIVSDVRSNLDLIREVVKSLDAVTPQVLIEAKIVETTLTNTENLGIDWTVQASANGSGQPSTFPFKSTHNHRYSYPSIDYAEVPFDYGTLDFSQFQVVLQMLKDRTNTNIVSNPRIVTLDNQPAKITVGKQYPVPQYTYNEEQARLQVSGWSYLDIGVIFSVTPHVNNAGLVTLDIEPSVTDILEYATVENTQMPVLSSETAKTSVMIKDGQTLVIAGLIKDKNVDGRKKVPFLGDIPVLGWPFQKKSTTVVKTDLLIFLTPHIITPDVKTAGQTKSE